MKKLLELWVCKSDKNYPNVKQRATFSVTTNKQVASIKFLKTTTIDMIPPLIIKMINTCFSRQTNEKHYTDSSLKRKIETYKIIQTLKYPQKNLIWTWSSNLYPLSCVVKSPNKKWILRSLTHLNLMSHQCITSKGSEPELTKLIKINKVKTMSLIQIPLL